MVRTTNVFRLGIKELWSLLREPLMLVLIVYTFTLSIYIAATAMPDTLHNAPIAVVDEDGSPLSARIVASFYPPHFKLPAMISLAEVDPGLDHGRYSFVLDIPPGFQRDVLAGRTPAAQLNVDATLMSQSFAGSGYIQQIVAGEVNDFVHRYHPTAAPAVDLVQRLRFNPNLDQAWFGSLMEIINNVTMLSIILTGAALIREREHGTIEHLLVMPVTPAEIMLAKVLSMGLVVLLAVLMALVFVVQGALRVPLQGSIALFMAAAALHLFATTSMGIFLATLARSMPQFGMLLVLVLLPLQLLSGGATPRESMPVFVRDVMLAAPTTHFVSAGQAILYRGASIDVVWPQFLIILAIGSVLFIASLVRFRKTIGQMASEWRVAQCRWWLDSPVFNSVRLKGIILGVAAEAGWPWRVELVTNPDKVLSAAEQIVSSSDHVILDRCQKWFNLARQVIANQVPQARVVDLGNSESASLGD